MPGGESWLVPVESFTSVSYARKTARRTAVPIDRRRRTNIPLSRAQKFEQSNLRRIISHARAPSKVPSDVLDDERIFCMTAHMKRPVGRPVKVVPNQDKADLILSDLLRADERLRATAVERVELALAANEAGLTTRRIAEAVGASAATVASWIRTARELRDSVHERNGY